MPHALTLFLRTESPLQLAALAAGFLLWLGLGVVLWRRLAWIQRFAYLAGGCLLGYYELHMTWYWLAAGVACLAIAVGPDLRDGRTGRGIVRH